MPKQRSPNRGKAKKLYLDSKGQIKLIDIATQLGVSDSQIRKWKNQDQWDKYLIVTLPLNDDSNSNVTIQKKYGPPYGNKNAKGNKGGSAPQGNKNAEKHGFFSKYLPDETLELVNEIDSMNPIDILWDNIQIQYAAIVRAQRIMHVKNKEELIKHVKKDGETSTEWEFQFAWDRQDTFLTAQSRAMRELTNMIIKYEELCKSELATEEQKARIEKIKAETNKLTGDNTEIEDISDVEGEIYGGD